MNLNLSHLVNLNTEERTILRDNLLAFQSDINNILESNNNEVVLFGSVGEGSYYPRKGDIDFIVITHIKNIEAFFNDISDLHRTYRRSDNFNKYLEGCYISVNEDRVISGGIYIGTNETGWKTFEGSIFNEIDHAVIYESGLSLSGQFYFKTLFQYDLNTLKQELVETAKTHYALIARFNDWDFRLHLIHSGARTLSLLKEGQFRSKTQSLQWLESLEDFSPFENLILSLSEYRSKLSLDEKSALDCIGVKAVEDFIKVLYEKIIEVYS